VVCDLCQARKYQIWAHMHVLIIKNSDRTSVHVPTRFVRKGLIRGFRRWLPVPEVWRATTCSIHLNENVLLIPLNMSKVLVINTGGTLSMKKNSDGKFINETNYFSNSILVHLRTVEAARKNDNRDAANAALMAAEAVVVSRGTPPEQSYARACARRIAAQDLQRCEADVQKPFELEARCIDVVELNPVLDSSEMGPTDWNRIATVINERYDNYIGFVVLHGTDTMGFTASALTFLLDTTKPVILTGSQNPILPDILGKIDEEALNNLIWSCKFAREDLPEVMVFFYRKLMRGVRTTKINADSHEHAAFDCPKTMPVVEFREHCRKLHRFDNEGHIRRMRQKRDDRDPNTGRQSVTINAERPAMLVRLFPGISNFMLSDNRALGMVIQAFGAGNGPIANQSSGVALAIRHAISDRKVVCFVTECLQGSVSDDYASSLGDRISFPGIVACSSMTAEAAYAKLCVGLSMYVLSDADFVCKVREYMLANVHGESDNFDDIRV
jgi:L-asparaginase/Glu-tRNA(Gln) amidotransferase subunit D